MDGLSSQQLFRNDRDVQIAVSLRHFRDQFVVVDTVHNERATISQLEVAQLDVGRSEEAVSPDR